MTTWFCSGISGSRATESSQPVPAGGAATETASGEAAASQETEAGAQAEDR